jgi:hypothetical protein
MISISNIADIQNKIAEVQQGLTQFSNRLQQLERFGELRKLGMFWDQNFHKTGTSIKPNAFIFGFLVNDWDKSYQSRDTKIKTGDLQIPFQYIDKIPDWKKSATYSEFSEVIGRFESINVYANSAAQDFQLVLWYQAESRLTSTSNTYWSMERVEQIVKRFQAMVYPVYTKGFAPPPKLLFNIGNIFRSVPVIVKDVLVENQPPYDVITGLPFVRKITLELKTSYPMWQAISSEKVFMSTSGGSCFAYKEMSQDYSQVNTSRSLGGVRNYNG